MKPAAIDTSVLVAAIVESEPFHRECRRLVVNGGHQFLAHGLAETFTTLTGGGKPYRMPPDAACALIEEDYVPDLKITSLTPPETLRAMRECKHRGVRGGAIYDFLHLVAARKVKAARLYTLNVSHFSAFHRAGDPEVIHP